MPCDFQIKQLEGWFKLAEAIRYATGQGSIDPKGGQDQGISAVCLFEFEVDPSEVNNIKYLKRRGAKKVISDDTLQSKCVVLTGLSIMFKCSSWGYIYGRNLTCDCIIVPVRILTACLWYEELEPVVRDRPMARRMFAQDTVGSGGLDMAKFIPLTHILTQDCEALGNQSDDPDTIPGSNPMPPPIILDDDEQSQSSLDPILRSLLASPLTEPCDVCLPVLHADNVLQRGKSEVSDGSSQSPASSFSAPRSRASTPTIHHPANKRQRHSNQLNQKAKLLPNYSPDTSRDLIGIKSMISQLPSKEEGEEAQLDTSQAQKQITTKITDTMPNIITSNRALELTTKKEIVLEEIQEKNCMAQGSMIVDLI